MAIVERAMLSVTCAEPEWIIVFPTTKVATNGECRCEEVHCAADAITLLFLLSSARGKRCILMEPGDSFSAYTWTLTMAILPGVVQILYFYSQLKLEPKPMKRNHPEN